MFVAALVVAAVARHPEQYAARLLSWMLILSVGVEETWAGLFHIFFPHTAATSIGWQVSPFQFEIGVADLAIGLTAIASFWRPRSFKAATVCYVSSSMRAWPLVTFGKPWFRATTPKTISACCC